MFDGTMTEKEMERLRGRKWDDIAPEIDKHISECFNSIRGLRNMYHDLLSRLGWGTSSVEYERAWGVGCRLYVRSHIKAWKTERGHCRTVDFDCDISWSATSRTVASSLAAIKLYQEVTEIAAEIESRWCDQYLLSEESDSE